MKTIDVIKQIRDNKSAKVLFFDPPAKPVVDEEGFDIVSRRHENEEDLTEVKEFERPRLLVDMQSANVIAMVYDAVKPETQVKIDKLLLTKSGFIRVNKICWESVKAA